MSGVVRVAKRRNRQPQQPAAPRAEESEASVPSKEVPPQSTEQDDVELASEEDKENKASVANKQTKQPARQSARLKIKAHRRGRQDEDSQESDSEASDSSSSDDGDDGIFVVDSILDRRERRGRVEYKIRWKRGDTTWEPEANMTGCSRLLQAFEEQRGTIQRKNKDAVKERHGRRGQKAGQGRRRQHADVKRRNGRTRDARQESDASEDEGQGVDGGISSDDDKSSEDTVRVRFRYGVRTEQGHRPENQDAYLVPTAPVDTSAAFNMFGVLDGHGEKGRFASERGVEILRDMVSRCYEDMRTTNKGEDEVCLVEKALMQALSKVDEELRADGETCKEEYGTTAVVCVQKEQDLIIANVGDSKAVVFREATGSSSRDKIVEVVTTVEHKVSCRREAARIWANNGQIGKDHMVYPGEDARCAGLAMTRALGHAVLSNYGVIATPDCFKTAIRDQDMLVIACDGLWDVLNTREVTRLVTSFMKEGKDPQTIASALVERAERKWIQGLGKGRVADNITVVVVLFNVQDD